MDDQDGQMGDSLVPIDLGTDFYPIQLGGGSDTPCVINTNGEAKWFVICVDPIFMSFIRPLFVCELSWGLNDYGMLGLGDNDNRGDGANQMGDNLPIIDFGSGFEVSKIRCSWVGYHCCALSMESKLKCMVCVY